MLRSTTQIRRRAVLGSLLATAATASAGCGAEWAPGVLEDGTRAGASADNDTLLLRNIVAVSATDGVGTLIMTVINQSAVDDALIAVQLEDGLATIRSKPSIVPASGITVYGVDTSQTTDPDHVILRGDPVKAGFAVQLTFVFERSAPVEAELLVKAPTGPFSGVRIPTATKASSGA